ncbi:hemagglutinin repeat-containing protein [Pseudomonas sp. COW5]|uniref:two-partner secretion domain-containing protein n=1 Tax=Pseudomonas sp. COW5 TaxID=2981253 RepID=UPI0022455932|nr:hemagglutinin repeat-containing protein [Pseudomonas sp. COW5]MCX2545953.1 hemagglutinin repeat-containing protein [Pseudomonas sp. COW5]
MDIRLLTFMAGQPSAAVKNRETFLGMPKRGLAFLLANVMFWQPMWAQADGIVVANPGTSLGQAGNGVPVINIATPNGAGLSHNQFHDYNVGAQGVILNNVAAQTGQTQLGGIIVGNPNLSNRAAAQAILNEVISGNPSQLRGYTEVAGQSARVIVANPYGITCNGCGFINSPRVTLTTGKPVLDGSGRLDRFQVDQGSIAIEGAGLNANNVDRFEIITRSAKINAEIQAKNLDIIAGRNDVNADNLNATARADDGSAKPQLAIDSSALGGMYAGAIKLVGTEAGVGVKLAGNVAASGGDIQIDANGQLTLAQTSAANNVNITAASLDAQGPVYAGVNVNVQTQGNLTNRQTLAARDNISLTAGGQLTNSGIIEAGVNADNSRNAAGNVAIRAHNIDNTGKSVIASRNLTVNATQTVSNQGGTLTSQNTRVTAATLDNQNKGRVLSTGSLSLDASQVLNTNGLINSAGRLDGSVGQLNNRGGEVSSLQDVTLRMATLDNVAGLVNAGKALSITTTGSINNQNGKLTSLGSLSLKAGHINNSDKGRIASNGALSVNAASLDQHDGGQLTSDTSLTVDLNNGALNNQKGLINAPLLVLKNLQQVDNRSGEISSAQAFTLAADSLDNSNGKLLSNQALTLQVQHALTNIKGLIGASRIDARVGSLNNNGGTFTSRADLDLHADGQLDNQDKGLINATQNLTITAANVNNQNGGSLLGSAIAIDFSGSMGDLNNSNGLITTKGQLSINHLRDLNNQGGELSSDLSYTLVARNLDNSDGKLFSRQRLDLNADSTRNLNGLISGWQNLSLLGGSLDNRNHGTLSSRDGDLLVDLTGDIRNSNTGALASKGILKITAANIDNSDQGALSSEGAQTLTVTGTLNNAQGGQIDSGAALDITAKRLDNTRATINAKQDIRFTGTDLDNTEGVLASEMAVNLDLLGTLTNTKGQLVGVGPLVIARATQINNQGGKLVSQKLLSLSTGGLDNRDGGTVAANDTLTIAASGVVQNSGGLIYSDTADLQLAAASLDNVKGTLQSEGALTANVGGAIDNQSGRFVAKTGVLNITAASLDSRGGVLSSLKSAFTAQVTGVLRNGQGGVIQAQYLTLKALAGLENEGGRITAQSGDAIIDLGGSGNFSNRNGALVAKQCVSVTGKDFDNAGDSGGQIAGQQIDLSLRGALNNRKGIIESASILSIGAASIDNQTGQLRALGSSGKTTFSLAGLFDNRNGTVESANNDLSLGAGGLLNVGGNVLHVGTGIFDIATGQLGSAGGSFVTRGGLTLTADGWTNSSLIQADRLTVNINNLNQTASGQLLAASKLIGNGGNWNNDGLIASDGSLDMTLWGDYSGNGRTSSLGDLTLKANQLTLNAATSIAGGGNTTINVIGLLTNQGRLTSSGDMTLTAANVNNYGTLGSGKDLTLTTGALLNDRGLITSGGDMRLLLASFTNAYGNVYGLNNVHIGRDRDSGKADLLDNRSGEIYSAQDLTINALTVNNVRDILEYTAHEKSSVVITQLDCNLIPIAGCDFRSGGRRNGHWEIAETDSLKVGNSSAAASLTSGGDMSLNVQALNNSSSTIAATGDIAVHAGTITNKGVQEQEIITKRTYWNYVDQIYATEPAAAAFNKKNSPAPSATVESDLSSFISMLGGGKLTESTTTVAGSSNSYDAVIQAGGNIELNATQTIDNSVVRPYYSYVAAGKTNTDTGVGSGYSTVVKINPQLPPDLAQQQVSPIDLPGFSLPTGQNGLFRLSSEGSSNPTATGPQSWTLSGGKVTADPSATPITINRVQGMPSNTGKSQPHKYLIETNPVLTDLKQFMSSDYLLKGLGYDADQSAKRLGDGLFEQKLVQQAVVARTGQRFIDGQTSDEAVYKYLMDNAIASKNALNLSVGVTLSAQQVAALTHDIVWLEEREVNGEKVLVPVLYLANANNRLASTGALIQGKDVTLIAGENLENSGTLRASQNLDATAKKDLVSSGLVEAGNLLKMTATDNLTNKAGGIISGRDVTLTAEHGDVINERTVTTHRSTDGRLSETTDFVDNAARIEAANALVIGAGRDISNSGSVLKSGGDTTLSAGRDVHIDSTEQNATNSNTNYLNSSVKQYGSDVDSGGALKVTAGGDINVVASQLNVKSDAELLALGDVTLTSAANESHRGGWNKKFRAQDDSVQQQSSSLTAGGKVTVNAGKDLSLIASQVSAGSEAYLVAGENLLLGSARDDEYSFLSKTKKNSSGKKSQLNETSSTTNVGSSVTSGGNSLLAAGRDLSIEGSNVISENGGVSLGAGNDVKIIAVTDSSSNRHESSSSKSSWGGLKSSKVQDQISEFQTTAVGSLVSGNTIAISAKRDVNIAGSAVVSTEDMTIRAVRDLTITAAENTLTRTEAHKEKNRDFTGVLTANKLGVDDITGNQHLSVGGVKHNGTMSQTTLTGSTIGSSQGNVSLVAGGDLSVIASDLFSIKNMTLMGSNVSIAAGKETLNQTVQDQSNNLGVGRVIGGAIVDTANAIRTAVKTVKDADDPRLKAIKIAQAALAMYNLGGADDPTKAYKAKEGGAASNGSLIKIGTELSNTHSKSTSTYSSQTAKQSTVNAGTGLTIIANGAAAGSQGDIHVAGSSLNTAGIAVLDAKRDVVLESAQNTTEWSNKNTGNKTAIGASFNLGQQNGFTLDLGASGSKATGNGHSVTQVNTTLGAGSLVLRSGGDTTLAGAQVSSETINANIGGNLNIVSRQDVETQENKQSSGGFGASICIPPFCFGAPVTGSANLAFGNMDSEYRAVTDQTGFFAGGGGYNIEVGKTTTLEGGVIASDATADKNRLSTDRLIVSDIKNISEINAQSGGVSVSGSYGGGAVNASVGGLYGVSLTDSDSSKTRSAVSDGTIVVRNADGANDLVGLNRDTKNANQQLDRPDEAAMKERVELVKSAIELSKGISDAIAAAKMKEANDPQSETAKVAVQKLKEQGFENPTPEQISQQVQRDFGMGSSFQKAAQAITSIVQGVLGGNISGALTGAAAPYVAQAIRDATEGDKTANLMAHAVLGALIAKVNGNSVLTGAVGAVVAEEVARILKEQLYGDISNDRLTSEQKQTISSLATLVAGIGGAFTGTDSLDAVTAALVGKNAVENNGLSSKDVLNWASELREAKNKGESTEVIWEKYKGLSAQKRAEMLADCGGTAGACTIYYQEDLVSGISVADGVSSLSWFLGLNDADAQSLRAFVTEENQYDMGLLFNSLPPYMKAALALKGAIEAGGTGFGGRDKTSVASIVGKNRGSPIPYPDRTPANNGLTYKSNPKHTYNMPGNNTNAGIEPKNSLALFETSIQEGKKRYSLDDKGNVHQFTDGNDGTWHWAGSTGDVKAPLNKANIPTAVKKAFGLKGKWR